MLASRNTPSIEVTIGRETRLYHAFITTAPARLDAPATVTLHTAPLPDVFVPACLTPGTTALLVVHNHPSGDPTPSPDDARLTARLAQAADLLDMPLLDHLIVGDAGRYFSFREAGTFTPQIADGVRA